MYGSEERTFVSQKIQDYPVRLRLFVLLSGNRDSTITMAVSHRSQTISQDSMWWGCFFFLLLETLLEWQKPECMADSATPWKVQPRRRSGSFYSRRSPFDLSTGIAGHVATTGEVLNIRDAYNHPLFYRRMDEKTGFKTRSILCFPIKVDEEVIGVAELCNKVIAHTIYIVIPPNTTSKPCPSTLRKNAKIQPCTDFNAFSIESSVEWRLAESSGAGVGVNSRQYIERRSVCAQVNQGPTVGRADLDWNLLRAPECAARAFSFGMSGMRGR